MNFIDANYIYELLKSNYENLRMQHKKEYGLYVQWLDEGHDENEECPYNYKDIAKQLDKARSAFDAFCNATWKIG